jgi:endonuclease/exonuclease/phosphatase family metal-dependent hydrolase
MLNRVTVAAWNVGHRARRKAIPEDLSAALEALNADVVFLTEFVDGGEDRDQLRVSLSAAGYDHVHLTDPLPVHNQVFVASRLPFDVGDIAPPTTDSHATSNFLHVSLHDSEIELIGMRAPSYKGAVKSAYWGEVDGILRNAGDRALVVAGDLNEDPFKGVSESFKSRKFHGSEILSAARPEGRWSFMDPHKETSRSRIDHVLHTPRVRIRDARYVDQIAGLRLAGPASSSPLSDHAALTFAAEIN